MSQTHLEGKEAVARHLRAKLQGNRKDAPEAGSWGSPSAASCATELRQTPSPGSKGKPPPKPPRTRRVDFTRAPLSRNKGQNEGQSLPTPPFGENAAWVTRLKKEIAQEANFHPATAKPGGREALNKDIGATSDPPQRSPAQQKWPLMKDKGAPRVPAKGAAVPASLNASGSTHETKHPALPQRKPLPHIRALGARPAKPRRPPVVDLEKFSAAAHPGVRDRPAAEPLRNAQPGYRYLKPDYTASGAARFPPQNAPRLIGEEDEIYDDVEPVGLLGGGQGFPLAPASQPPAYSCSGGGGNAGLASNRVALMPAEQREAQTFQRTKVMTLKECKKEEKADREFQKKFKFEGSIRVLTQMMVDPAATEKRGGGKNLPLRRGEILDVIQFTNQEQILCRNSQRRYGYVPRAVMLHLDTDLYDDVEIYG
ncbi:PML-RARA-regulated adapter molecule 1 isoform X2 [Struthio camelus]|uniref:PML-RARA-regulated adapter molecule 1 isoform X2 n=1 Tax=Struthio camelus TaxID=8801 RepID=UPI0036042A85